jgi:ABC-type proline/glycine betaine transport system permease subunit
MNGAHIGLWIMAGVVIVLSAAIGFLYVRSIAVESRMLSVIYAFFFVIYCTGMLTQEVITVTAIHLAVAVLIGIVLTIFCAAAWSNLFLLLRLRNPKEKQVP